MDAAHRAATDRDQPRLSITDLVSQLVVWIEWRPYATLAVMSEQTTITTEIRDHILLIGLNRPDKLNAFNTDMLTALSQAYTAYQNNQELWCAVLFAHGKGFTAGLDLANVGPVVAKGGGLFPSDGIDPLDVMREPERPRRTKPIVCAVHGWCLTIGLELLMASDIRIAARNTKFSQLEVRRGIMPFGGATFRMPQLAGWGNAMRYLLTGEQFDANEAYRIGLIQEVVDDEKLFDQAILWATKVAKQAPLAVQASLVSARTAVEQGTDAALSTLMDEARRVMTTEDATEGMKSFIERREGKFQGR